MSSSSKTSVPVGYAVSALFLLAWVGLAIAAYVTPRGDAFVAGADGTTDVPFAVLSGYCYDPPPLEYDADGNPKPAGEARDPVPRAVRGLSGRRVRVGGYMIPYDFTDGRCTKFALAEFPPSCCFGCTALPNNWVEVTMADGTTAACANGEFVRAQGVLHVAALDDELATLYTMRGETATVGTKR